MKFLAVHQNDLKEFLEERNVLDSVNKKQRHCVMCQALITVDNIFAVIEKGNKIKFCCDKPECILRFSMEEQS